jgi:hypothetical protein
VNFHIVKSSLVRRYQSSKSLIITSSHVTVIIVITNETLRAKIDDSRYKGRGDGALAKINL